MLWKRIAPRILKTSCGCWVFLGSGVISVNNKSTVLTRALWEERNGRRLRAGEQINHHCDIPLCVRPSHLYVGSHQDNMNDLRERGLAKGIPKSAEWKAKMSVSMRGNRNPQKPARHCEQCGAPTPRRRRKLCDKCVPPNARATIEKWRL